jgi:hypothetical protein
MRGPSAAILGGANRGAPSADFFQLPNPAAQKVEDQDVDVPRAELP